jgi:1-acyl-sn-glycerol-3-phosphate acyltransferase
MSSTKVKEKAGYGGRPNGLLYFIVCRLSKIFLKVKYGIQFDNSAIKVIKPPLIVLGNHPSSLDPFIISAAMYPHRINFLGTNYYFRNVLLRPFLKLGGIIPKIQFYRDTRAIRMMNKVISDGGILGICPEGRRSADGRQHDIPDSIAKLIKLYKVPVVAVVSQGAYLSLPRWSVFSHKGSIEVTVKAVLSAEQVEKLTIEEIHKAVCSSLYYNDYEWNKTKKISFRHKKIAENIHYILHKCAGCGADKAMAAKGNRLYCKLCSNAALMNEYMFLQGEREDSIIFEDTVKWLHWQRAKAGEQVQDSSFSMSSVVTKLRIADGFTGPYREAGKGELFLNRKGLTFKGTVDSKPQELFFPLKVLASISSEFGVNFEITDGKNTYCFSLEDGQDVIVIELAIEQLTKENTQGTVL